ncbi:MAG: ABC transporter ATP-binding protein [Actinobacteria bacterium]|nr:ABC transporter ATP-binding protein [Actinomycetota bacterium]
MTGLGKSFDDVVAVRGIDLDIAAGEFFSLLGPSGCGKTTTLRMVGGFERPDRGSIGIDGIEITDLAPERRPVNTVFQSYALFPHLDVAANVAFGLRFTKPPADEASERVAKALALVELSGYGKRKTHQLSGGQQQRVALARALILEPRVLLLDEPLGALDAKLRKTLQVELRTLQREIGITFIYVTHDQEEALTMSDRLAVMREGEIVQIGAPKDVYESPVNTYVADFLGVANLLEAEHLGDGQVRLGDRVLAATGTAPTGPCRIVIRPERVRLAEASGGMPTNALPVTVERRIFTGATTQVHLRSGDATFHALVTNDGREHDAGVDLVAELPVDALRIVAED